MEKERTIIVSAFVSCSDQFNEKAESGRFVKKGLRAELRHTGRGLYDLVFMERKKLLGYSDGDLRDAIENLDFEEGLRRLHDWQKKMEASDKYEKTDFTIDYDDEEHYADTARKCGFDLDARPAPKPLKKFGL